MNTISESPFPVAEKPPVSGASPSTRRRKVNRSSPVPVRRHSSPLRRSRTFDATSTRVPEDRKEIVKPMDDEAIRSKMKNEETTKGSSNEETCCCVRKRSVSNKELASNSRTFQHDGTGRPIDVMKERRQDYLDKRRSTFATMNRSDMMTYCQCRTHRGALKPCVCSGRRRTISPKITESELMEKETRLVVLEFLRGLSPEQLSGRRRTSREGSVSSWKSALAEDVAFSPNDANDYEVNKTMFFPSDVKREFKRERASTQKFNTVTIGEHEHRQLMELIASSEYMNDSMTNGGTRLGRSRSDITEEHYAATRARIQKLEAPVKRWIESNSTIPRVLKRDIVNFKKSDLKPSQSKSIPIDPNLGETGKEKRKKLIERKNLQPLSLKIPPQMLPSANPLEPDENLDIDIFTPETYAVNRLEVISDDIMRDFPDLLQVPISNLISMTTNDSVNYDLFSKVAKPVFDLKVPRFSSSVWPRIALVLYMVRETVFLGNMNDRQLELLVEHSTKFFTENAKESVEEQGGWESAVGDQMFFANGMIFDPYSEESSDDNDLNTEKEKKCPHHGYHSDAGKDVDSPIERKARSVSVSDTAKEWSTYGVVVMTVALGLAYSYLKY